MRPFAPKSRVHLADLSSPVWSCSIFDADLIVTSGFGDDVGGLDERLRDYIRCVVMTERFHDLTLFALAFLSISKDRGVWVPNLFGNDLLLNDLPYSKGFMKFKWLKPS